MAPPQVIRKYFSSRSPLSVAAPFTGHSPSIHLCYGPTAEQAKLVEAGGGFGDRVALHTQIGRNPPDPATQYRRLEQTNAGIGISGSDSAILPAGPDCGGGGGRHRWNQSGKRKPKADLRTRFLFGAPLRLLLLLCRSAVKTEKGHLPAPLVRPA